MMRAFTPSPGSTVSIAATSVSSSQSIPALNQRGGTVRVYNAGPSGARVRWGTGAQTAVTADVQVPAGAIEIFTLSAADTIAAKTDSGTATVEFTFGEGL